MLTKKLINYLKSLVKDKDKFDKDKFELVD